MQQVVNQSIHLQNLIKMLFYQAFLGIRVALLKGVKCKMRCYSTEWSSMVSKLSAFAAITPYVSRLGWLFQGSGACQGDH